MQAPKLEGHLFRPTAQDLIFRTDLFSRRGCTRSWLCAWHQQSSEAQVGWLGAARGALGREVQTRFRWPQCLPSSISSLTLPKAATLHATLLSSGCFFLDKCCLCWQTNPQLIPAVLFMSADTKDNFALQFHRTPLCAAEARVKVFQSPSCRAAYVSRTSPRLLPKRPTTISE